MTQRERILELLSRFSALQMPVIAAELGMTKSRTNAALTELRYAGHVERYGQRRHYYYRLGSGDKITPVEKPKPRMISSVFDLGLPS